MDVEGCLPSEALETFVNCFIRAGVVYIHFFTTIFLQVKGGSSL